MDVVNFQRAHFFDCLSPWEIEQLVAIRDLLAAAVIGPPLRALVELRKNEALQTHHCGPRHGSQVVYWTSPILPPNLERRDCHINQNQARLLCFGIKFLYEVSVSPYAHFYQLLRDLPQQPRYASYNRVGEIYSWFTDAVDECIELSNLELPFQKALSSYTEDEYKAYVRQSLVAEDPDKGPEEAWYWAYQSFPGSTCNDLRMTNCRLFGLFFWDSSRLKTINFFTRVDFWWWRVLLMEIASSMSPKEFQIQESVGGQNHLGLASHMTAVPQLQPSEDRTTAPRKDDDETNRMWTPIFLVRRNNTLLDLEKGIDA
ncbi:hypothetical protein CH063_01253 [Colletotrichum higginsianum]|uniref:Uncharacterized protein n=1 Tax=Colletotrichum higginsianum (strain IMI 349063) TaxID=759273 RepID=H1V4K0_COLHI|nr:hypothetical protein CH063_01253 [Colletotrichum higginsianum]